MSVATKNPFAILDAEDPSRPSTPAAPAAQDTPSAPPPAASSPTQKSKGPASRGGRYYSRGGGANKHFNKEQSAEDASAPPATDAAPRKYDNDGRGRGRGRGRGGPRGGGRGRQFDRHSGTGKTDSDKKVHQSWGGDDGNTELKVEEAATNDAAVEGATDWAPTNDNGWGGAENTSNDWGVDPTPANDDPWGQTTTPAADADPTPTSPTGAVDADKTGRERKGREPEEEDNTLTLDQYLAQKKDSDLVPKLEGVRKANDGAEDIWRDAVPLRKDQQQDTYFVGKAKTTSKPRAKKEEKQYIEIEARFERPSRGGRGGRGGDRGDRPPRGGGRGRGAPRGRANGTDPIVNVDDQAAFPSLA